MEEHQELVDPHNGPLSSTQDPEEEQEKHRPTEANHAENKQQEVSSSPTQNKEQKVNEEIQADLEVNASQFESKQEEEDKVDTFFSTMSHRYEAHPFL